MGKKDAMLGQVVRKLGGVSIEILGIILDLLEKFTANNKQEWLKEFKKFLRKEVCWGKLVSIFDFFIPLFDEEAVEALVKAGKYSKEETKEVVAKWRELADELGYNGPIVWQVKAGFTSKEHALKAGPCHNNWEIRQDCSLRNDESTKKSLVFFIPRLIEGSTKKTADEQLKIMIDLQKELGLPENHLTSFGSISLLAGLILTHFKRTGERTPLERKWVRTDTFNSNISRMDLGSFDDSNLSCDYWTRDVDSFSGLGCFPLGIELLEG